MRKRDATYCRCWAEDVVGELTGSYCSPPRLQVEWVLRWMDRNELDPEGESVCAMADACRSEFWKYVNKASQAGKGMKWQAVYVWNSDTYRRKG